MGRTAIGDAGELTVGDVIHKRFSVLAANATIADAREWFAASSHRRMAFLADRGRYKGSLTPADLEGDLEPTDPASTRARRGPTVAPTAPARVGHELAIATDARRIPVVDDDGTLIGVLSVTDDLAGFCGTT